jgi:hypothetical protein
MQKKKKKKKKKTPQKKVKVILEVATPHPLVAVIVAVHSDMA